MVAQALEEFLARGRREPSAQVSERAVETEFVFGRHAAAELSVAYGILVRNGGPASRGPARKDGRPVTSAAIYARVS